jgi:hypothetical protein
VDLYRNVILGVVALSIIYALVITALILALRSIRVPRRGAIVLGFLVFGGASGLLAALAWPLDSSVYFNVFAAYAADQISLLCVNYLFRDASAPDGHLPIPWLLQLPQLYVPVSILLCGLVSLPVQWAWNRKPGPSRP